MGTSPRGLLFLLTILKRKKFIEGMLQGQKLLVGENNTIYRDYFLNNTNNNPLEEGYSGIVAFESYQSAHAGLRFKR